MLVDVNLKLRIIEEDIECIIETAGYGIGYWCGKAIVKDGLYEVYDSDNKTWHKLDYNDIMYGVAKYIEENYDGLNIIYVGCCGRPCIDCGQIDSDIADMIIQYACFGRIYYG